MKEEKKPNEKKKIDFKYNLSIYYSFLKNYKWVMLFVLFLVLILEARHTLQSYLYKILIDRGTEFAAGSLMFSNFTRILVIIALVFLGVLISGTIGRWIYIHFLNKLESGLIVDLKRRYFNHILDLDHSFHTTHKTGSLISRLTRAGGAMERVTDVITFNFAPMFFSLIVVTISLAYFDWISSIVVFSTIAVFVAYSFFIQKISESANLAANDAEDREKANVADIFINVDSIKYFGKENLIKRRFEKLTDFTRRAFLKNWNYFRWLDSIQTFILGIGTLLIVYFPITRFLNNEISLGTVVFVYTVYATLMSPLFGFVYGLRQLYRGMADFQDLFEYGKVENKIKDKLGAGEMRVIEGNIEFQNIDFSYAKRKIFDQFSLKIPAGKKVALVGHSGSGKSTLVKLLYRLYDVDSGKILVDGKDIRDVKHESLRSEMAIVPQECVLFDDTVYNNIAFSNPQASRRQVLEAIRFAQLDKIIKEFPQKENTIVGERGIKLSGGEKQRVSIARALLADKKILVLDEATSSLDSLLEHEIQEDLKQLMKGRTSIIIAHRLSTIMSADVIVVLDRGKIVQVGTHKNLSMKNGLYRRLWTMQKGGYIK